jgi:formate--tetrahydrofolate ligase
MRSDIDIANDAKLLNIYDIAKKYGLDDIEPYGRYKAKINLDVQSSTKGKLVLVSAINPTPAGEGKTTTAIGLAQALNILGEKAVLALREPSLGPCMGVKGGAAGGGYSQIAPMDEINMHFTGDIHAVSSAHNLLAAMIDNHLHHGNSLGINTKTILWSRAIDINDRALRNIIIGLMPGNSLTRESSFLITAASEVMAILCLASDIGDLKRRLGKIIIGFDRDKRAVTAQQLNAHGAMTALLKDAFKPNMVQTLENTAAIVHGGPFANIAHGCNSIVATKLALSIGDIVVTEAGFGADLGAEKFFNIKCRQAGIKPNAVVLVATIRSIKLNGGSVLKDISSVVLNIDNKGFYNLKKHIENVQKFGINAIVALNVFDTDIDSEIDAVREFCKQIGVTFVTSKAYMDGGYGCQELAQEVLKNLEIDNNNFNYLYNLDMPVEDKILIIAKEIHRVDAVLFTKKARADLSLIQSLGYSNMPVCIAKTQYETFDKTMNITGLNICAGAGFIVVLTDGIMTMPGLPVTPAAENIDVVSGKILGIF